MLTALILICSTAATPDIRDCTRNNAAAVMRMAVRFRSPLHASCTGEPTSPKPRLVDGDSVATIE
jgi:hypothetical protein